MLVYLFIILAPERQIQEDFFEFGDRLGYIVSFKAAPATEALPQKH